jgi:hypothetical protein
MAPSNEIGRRCRATILIRLHPSQLGVRRSTILDPFTRSVPNRVSNPRKIKKYFGADVLFHVW